MVILTRWRRIAGRLLPAAAVLTAACLLLGACPRRVGDTLRTPVRLPADWPLPQLQPPPGVEADVVPERYRSGERPYQATASGRASGGGRFWLVAFDGTLSWRQFCDYASDALGPLGYRLADVRDQTGLSSRSAFNEYVSADGRVTVRAGYEKSPGTVAYPGYDCYYFKVTVRQ